MALDGVSHLSYSPVQFGTLTTASRGVNNYNPVQGNNNLSQRTSVGIPSTEDMERASAYLQGLEGLGSQEIAAIKGTKAPQGLTGSAYDGFTVPPNNGTGELIPNVSDREDSIPGCPWEAYPA